MAIKKFKPVTPGTRFRSTLGNEEITRDTPEKSLLEPLRGKGGRKAFLEDFPEDRERYRRMVDQEKTNDEESKAPENDQ